MYISIKRDSATRKVLKFNLWRDRTDPKIKIGTKNDFQNFPFSNQILNIVLRFSRIALKQKCVVFPCDLQKLHYSLENVGGPIKRRDFIHESVTQRRELCQLPKLYVDCVWVSEYFHCYQCAKPYQFFPFSRHLSRALTYYSINFASFPS